MANFAAMVGRLKAAFFLSASALTTGATWWAFTPGSTAPSVAPQMPETSASVNEPASEPATPPKKVYADKNVEAGGKKFVLKADVQEAFAQSRFPDELLIDICARESTCDPTIVNDKSGAMGLFQFLPNTLYETLYKYGAQHGYAEEAKLVQRYRIEQKIKDKKQAGKDKANNKAHNDKTEKDKVKDKKDEQPVYGYRPVSEAAKEIIKALALNPFFNTKMHDAYTYTQVQTYMAKQGKTATHAEVTAINQFGRAGTEKFLAEVKKNEQTGKPTLSRDFFAQNKKLYGGDMSANWTLLFDKNKKPITVTQAWDGIKKFGGDKPLAFKPQ